MAKLGFGMLVVMQNEWPKAAEDVHRYREVTRSVGHTPRPPIILTNVSCAESREEARERGMRYLGRKWDSIDTHYNFSDGHLGSVKGYESYGKLAKTYAKMKDPAFRDKATDFYISIQVAGTPEDAELNMRLFADRVMPILQRDAVFSGEVAPSVPRAQVEQKPVLFAPA